LLVQGLTEALLAWWYPMHNVFAAWDWPEAEVVLAHPGTGEPVILAGSYGSGRMVLSGSDPDYHSGEPAADLLLHNELYWAAGVVADTPPQVVEAVPQPGSETAARAIIEASFDQLVDPSTVDASSVQVVGSLSGPVLGSVTYYSRTAGLVFEPASDLLVGEVVTVTLSASIEDMSGIGLDSDGDGVAEGSPEDDSVWTFLVRVGETLVVTDPTDPQPEDAAGLASGLTLRQALEQAQAGDTITFDPTVFPPGSPVTIPLSGEPLPELWQGYLTLDASAAGVILDGSGLNWGPGLRITSDGNVVRGLHILRAPEDGLQLDQGASRNLIGGTPPSPGGPCGGDCNLFSGNGNNGIWVGGSAARHNIIKGNYVGTNADGTGAMGNAFNGVTIWEAPYTQVESNLISANCTSGDWCDGLGMYGAGVVSSVVVGNQIGVDASGLNPLGNHGSGITVAYGASDNRIGGSSAAERNIVSANQNGIELVHDYTMGNALLGNYVGTDASGLVALGNQWEGISLEDSANTRVGGAAPGEGNVIAGNGGEGLRGQPSSAQIVGNYVGTDATGLGALGNGGGGIALYGTGGTSIEGNLVANNNYGIRVDGSNNVIRNNQIGVNAAGDPSGHPGWGLAIVGYQNASGQMDSFDNWVEGNVIAHSGQGVLVYEWGGARVNGNTLTQNSIYGSSGLSWLYNLDDGISLYGNANHNLAPPVVGAFNVTAGTASGTACADCTVEVFSDDDDEGRWYEGTVGADGAGTWFLIKGSPFSGANVHATATDANGNTSEFSGPPPIVSSVSPTSTVAGTANLGVILSGDFFRDNELLAVGFGDGINVTSVEFRDHKQIKVYLDVDGGAALGPRDVTVTNYEGQSGTLPAGFEVVPVPPPPPTVTGVVADQIAPGASGNLRIYGTGFIDRPAVAFGGGGVTVEEVTFDDPTRLTVHVSVDPAASLGLRDVTVTNPDGQADTLLAGLSVVPPRFEEVGGAAGVDDVGDGLGVAWGDYDGDGDQDLFVAQGGMAGGEADILYQNQGDGTFADVSGAAGLGDEGPARAAVWGDYDNDGDLDLYVTRYGQANLLYANNGDGTFAEGAASAGVDRTGDSSGAAWADYDLDGQLDLFVVGESSPNVLYRNNGDCTFDDVTGAAGVAGEGSGQEGAAWGDYDDDGDPDLYVASNAAPNQLYRNNGDGTFTEVGSPAGVDDARASRGVAWGDLDNDSDLDLYVTNYGDVDAIYRNNGNGTFTDVAAQAGTDEPANGTGVSLGDFDNDGDLDIWVINAGGPKTLYLNRGDGTFMPDLEPALEHGGNAHGGAAADYDNDGDLDLYLTNRDDGNPNLLYRNGTDVTAVHAPAAAPHWLHVRLVGTLSNARGIGARVRVVAGGLSQIRGVSGGSGFWSQDSLPAEFGLGSHVGPVTVEVTWPSGVVDSLPGVTADQVLTVVESTPYLHNMAVVSVAPDGEQPAGVPFHPVVTLRNLGQLAETGVPVTCRIEYDGGQVYLQPMASGLVVPGAWATLVFPAFAPTDTGEHLMTCWVRLPGDENPADDELSRELLVTQQIADAWTKDNPTDDGDVPSGLNNWYGSPDLWVRHAPDGGLIHQDPVAGVENTVYVRIRNRGNTPVYEGTVSVYWIEPSLGVRCGDWASIADIFFTDLLPGEVRIVSTPWVPTRTGHTCLQDVIDSAQDPYDRGLECAPQWVPWDNNVEWRNVNVYSNPGGVRAGLLDVKDAEVQLVNVYDRSEDVDMIVERLTFPLSGDILVQLPSALFDRWLAYGKHWGEGIEVLPATNEIRVTGEISATIGAIPMQASEEVTVGLHFEGPAGLAFELATRERIGGITTGGVGYQWIIPDTTPPEVIDTVPAAGAVGVALDAPLAITFSEPIGPLTLELVLAPDPGGWSLIWNEAGTVVTATHTAFEMGTTYQATATAGDAAGNQMVSAKSWTFTAVSEENRVYLPLILRH
jgi:parallel beta-helix repeat protein